MSTRSAVQEAKRWAFDLLNANAALIAIVPRIYVDQVQRESNGLGKFPYILGNFMGGVDVPGLGTNRVQTRADFQWRIVCEGPPTDDIRTAETLMDDSLQTAVAQLSNGWYFSCRRVTPIDRPEYDNVKTKRYSNLGGIYRLWIYKA